MTTLPRALEMLNGNNYTVLPFILQWQDIYYRTSLHTTGTCPSFHPLGEEGGIVGNQVLYPVGWLHQKYDYIFNTHLLNRYPREAKVTREWRKSVYRPYQMAPLLESISSISAAIMGDSKYTLNVDDKDDDDYIKGKNFDGRSLVDYVKHHFKTICEDSNSLFIVIPDVPNTQTTSVKVRPIIKHIPTRNIVWIAEDEIIFVENDYAWFVNGIGYFRYQKIKDAYVAMDGGNGYYAHMLGRRPAHFAGGFWNTHKYYDSYLKPAQAFCDDFVGAHSAVQTINKEASHPFIQAASTDCPECDGRNHIQYCNACSCNSNRCSNPEEHADVESGNWRIASCPKCGGKGQQSRNPADWLLAPPKDMDKDLIKVIEFDVATNEYLDKHAQQISLGIRKALYQDSIEEAQSGVAKEIDREARYLYRSTVSDGVWDLIEKLVIDILSIRNTSTANGQIQATPPKYTLVKPTDFDLKTEDDLLDEYDKSTKANTPDFIRQKQIEQYADKLYGGDDVFKRKTSLINQMDSYSVMAPADKLAMFSAQAIDPRVYQFSNEISGILDEVVRTKGSQWFVRVSYDEIKAEVDIIFTKVNPLPTPVVKTISAAA